MADAARPRYDSIQVLRALAALMVVVHHSRGGQFWPDSPAAGFVGFATGIEIFFGISGFIMVVVASDDRPGPFLAKRAIRIVPLYWLATLAALVIVTRGRFWEVQGGTWLDVLLSLFFIPHYSSRPGVEDTVTPYHLVGWTLDNEMLFYVVFALGLLLRRPVLVSTLVIGALVVLGQLIAWDNPVWVRDSSPLLMHFLVGVWIAVARQRGAFRRPGWIVLLPVGLAAVLVHQLFPETLPQQLWLAAGTAAILIGALALEGRVAWSRWPLLLGDASYSIYLTHPLTISVLVLPLMRLLAPRLPDAIGPAVIVLLSLVLSTAIGVLVHRFVERPLLAGLRARLLGQGLPAVWRYRKRGQPR